MNLCVTLLLLWAGFKGHRAQLIELNTVCALFFLPLFRYVCVMASSNIQPQAKAQRTVELLVNAFEYHFIYARHLELLCEIFDEYGQVPCSEFFGTYRVELVVSLYACVVDLHNFEIVMRRLTPFEAGCVVCRLGWLHLYNPMKPEGKDLLFHETMLVILLTI